MLQVGLVWSAELMSPYGTISEPLWTLEPEEYSHSPAAAVSRHQRTKER